MAYPTYIEYSGVWLPGYILLDGVEIKRPTDFKMTRYNITKSERSAAGLMSMEFVAKKRKFEFKYSVLSSADYEEILDIIDTNSMVVQLNYDENGVGKWAWVYGGEITQTKYRTAGGSGYWYWKDVGFNLIEM